jgi:hypothetical protein
MMMTNTFAQSLKEMIADNDALTKAYWNFVKTEYTAYDGHRARLRTDHYRNGMWETEPLKNALLSFEANELKRAKAPLEAFEKKYENGDLFMEKFEADREMQMKALSSKTDDRLKRIRIESDFKNENQITGSHYFKYREKIDHYTTFKQTLAGDIYSHALSCEEQIGKYNKEVIVEEMKKLLRFVLWLYPGHAEARAKLDLM